MLWPPFSAAKARRTLGLVTATGLFVSRGSGSRCTTSSSSLACVPSFVCCCTEPCVRCVRFFDEPPHIPTHKKQRPSAPAVIPRCTSRPAVSMVLSASSLIFPRRAPSPHQSYSSGTLQDYPSASETLCCGQTYRPLWARFDHRGQSCKKKICKTISVEQQERT